MSYLLTSAQMKAIDNRTISEFMLPARLLMENAGKSCADYILIKFSPFQGARVVILHGTGNNSGDGFVIARYLKLAAVNVCLVQLHYGTMSEETKINYDICKLLDIPMYGTQNPEDQEAFAAEFSVCDLVIDAVFGIGFKGKLAPDIAELFQSLHLNQVSSIAIDIPSGVDADTGTGEDAFNAHLTLCIHAPKLGSVLSTGKVKSGTLVTLPIGIPEFYHFLINTPILLDNDCCEYPTRNHYSHKGDYGRVVIIGGSIGYTGSVILSARAALRSGAGYVKLHSRKAVEAYYQCLPPEIMFSPVAQLADSDLPDDTLFLQQLDIADSILIGPGLGLDAYALKLLELVLIHSKVPTVLDADALRLLAENPDLFAHLKKRNFVLTPHLGEFCTLSACTMSELKSNIPGRLKSFVKKHRTKVLLKSDTTIFTDGYSTYLNTSGNDGLSTGGSGDVLSGIIASFAAQKMELGKAAINASYLLGKTAEYLATKRSTASIIPSDIIDHLFVEEPGE